MNHAELTAFIRQQGSYLCVGLDTDINKIPKHLLSAPDPVFEFNRRIIDATKQWCVSYKVNTAFYEAMGIRGWESMQRTVEYIPATHFKIADAKRGDIGNTSAQYAKAFFETLNFDAITVAPYMGEDSIRPFLEYKDKFTIVLGLTSNAGAKDFELQPLQKGGMLYETVLKTVAGWGTMDNLMFVVGATQAAQLAHVRTLVPDHFLLVPGVGFQGGSLAEVSEHGLNGGAGLLVNASRAIIYASGAENFAEEAAVIAQQYQAEMKEWLSKK
jgi:orotidine-5'-phosphate decarboxylase